MAVKSKSSLETDQSRQDEQPSVDTGPESTSSAPAERSEVKSFLKRAFLFVLIGLGLYLCLYLISELLLYKYTVRNRFYTIKTAEFSEYDYVILGASHAAVFDYDDMNDRLEQMTGTSILNLSTLGGGVTVNRLVMDYFLIRHETEKVIYFLDSFAFYSPEWNEERVQDVQLYQRAPFDPALAWLLIKTPSTRSMVPGYLSGFYKINNPDRFQTDITEEEATRFDKTYRPVKQIDRQRMSYLYPDEIDQETFQQYLAEFEALIQDLQAQEIEVLVVKPPIPERVYQMLPAEEQFDQAVKDLLERHDVPFHDFALVCNDEAFFFNTDHLNRTGVTHFYEQYLQDLLTDSQANSF